MSQHPGSWVLSLFIFRMLRPYLTNYIILLVMSLAAVPIALLLPLPLMLVTDHIVGDRPWKAAWLEVWPALSQMSSQELLWIAVGITIAAAALQQLESYGNWLLQTKVGEKSALHLKLHLVRHLLNMPSRYHKEVHSADSLYRLQSDIPAVSYIPIQWIIMLSSSLTVLVMLTMTTLLSVELAILSLCVIPILVILLKIYEPISRQRWNGVKETETQFLAELKETVSSPILLKTYRLENLKIRDLQQCGSQSIQQQLRANLFESLFGSSMAITLAVGAALILYVGTQQVFTGQLSLGSLILIMGYLAQIYRPLEHLAKKTAGLQSALTSAERLRQTFQKQDVNSHAPLYQGPIEGSWQLKSVGVHYVDSKPILENLNLNIPKGSIVGISGPSGGGKTTLLHTLLGLNPIASGQILLDERPLEQWHDECLRSAITVVFQDTILFSGSIYENIAIAGESCSYDEVIAAAKAANAHDFICALPDSYQTQVGENGVKLSGGERQRLALARAFLRNSPILLLDEPTSQVDDQNAEQIMTAIQRLSQGRTTIMISHSMTSLGFCQIRYRLENGTLHPVTDPAWP